jgi:hypothetical protein
MKTLFPTILIALTLLSTGCALLEPAQDHDQDSDPILSAARRVRGISSEEVQALEEVRYLKAERIRRARTFGEIVLGMGMHDVMSVWGRPSEIENAGTAANGNQRWVYAEGLQVPWSLGNTRVVYFENGEVIGWKTAQ